MGWFGLMADSIEVEHYTPRYLQLILCIERRHVWSRRVVGRKRREKAAASQANNRRRPN